MKYKGFRVPLIPIFLALISILIVEMIAVKNNTIPTQTPSLAEIFLEHPPKEPSRSVYSNTGSQETQRATYPLNFVPVNLSSVNSYFGINVATQASGSVEPVMCLDKLNKDVNDYVDLSNPGVRSKDPNISKLAKLIESYQYSDEEWYADETGKVIRTNQGKTSSREIAYSSICKLNGIYFFSYSGFGPTVHVGGGGTEPSHFAFSDGLGNITVIDNIVSKSVHITLPKPKYSDDISEPTSTSGIAYYSCGDIIAANNLEVLIRCGGGDGPAGGVGIFLVNLADKSVREKVFCFSNAAGNYSKVCYRQNGERYIEEINETPVR